MPRIQIVVPLNHALRMPSDLSRSSNESSKPSPKLRAGMAERAILVHGRSGRQHEFFDLDGEDRSSLISCRSILASSSFLLRWH